MHEPHPLERICFRKLDIGASRSPPRMRECLGIWSVNLLGIAAALTAAAAAWMIFGCHPLSNPRQHHTESIGSSG